MNPLVDTVDFNQRPFIAIWEVTQACDLACVHCRASAQPERHPLELSTEEGKALIDQIAALEVPVFVLTGGDPIKRPDLFELIGHARKVGVRVSLTPSATPLLTREVVFRLKEAGLARLAVSMDGASAATHDAFRGLSGSFARTLEAVRWANEAGLPVQINTTFSRRNIGEIDAIVALIEQLRITLWSVFFLVPTGRGKLNDLLSADEFERSSHRFISYRRRLGSTSRRLRRSTIGATCCSRESPSASPASRPKLRLGPKMPSVARLAASATAKVSCSSPTWGKCFPADFCRCRAAASASSPSRRFTATRPFSVRCAIRPCSKANAEPANSKRSAAAPAPARTP
jgi:MoaA/NifB/PqqE/SkfB family radical SAM enzyme